MDSEVEGRGHQQKPSLLQHAKNLFNGCERLICMLQNLGANHEVEHLVGNNGCIVLGDINDVVGAGEWINVSCVDLRLQEELSCARMNLRSNIEQGDRFGVVKVCLLGYKSPDILSNPQVGGLVEL